MTALIVPIDVAALCVGLPDTEGQDPGGIAMGLAPMAAFSVLPYIADGTIYNDGPYISANAVANSTAFAGAVPLPQGIHLHWALPAGLSRGIQGGDGRQSFPAVPGRWLVTRVVTDMARPDQPQVSTRSWVVESDRLSVSPTAAVGLPQPTVPLTSGHGQNFRYLGASYDLPGWREQGDTAERLSPFTAIGYGEHSFAGFYPNCSTSFGFLDTLADLTDYQAATSTVSYHVAGWYADGTGDPLAGGDVPPGNNRYGWTWSATEKPTATVCSGVIGGIPWNPDTAYLLDGPQPLTVAVADTGPEALSALMASLLGQDAQQAADIEFLLNALQFGLLSKTAQVDSLPTFADAVHDAGFASLKGGSVWSVVSNKGSADGGEVSLPDALAAELNALNVLAAEADALAWDITTRRRQLFADWYKYLIIRHPSSQVPPDDPTVLSGLLPPVAAVQAYLDNEAQAIEADATLGGALDRLYERIEAAAVTLRGELPATLTLRGDTPAPPYRQPVDPVLLLTGADITVPARHRPANSTSPVAADGLPCRLDDQVVTAVTLDKNLIQGSAQETVSATALPGLAALPAHAPAALLQALLREAFLLSPPLQPAVTAACAALGGPANPAVLSFAGTTSALQQAAAQFVAGTAPTGVAYQGSAPDPTALAAWAGTPWLPLLLQYETAFHPLEYIDQGKAGGYPPGFINADFTLAPGDVDLEYASGQPQGLQVYTGSTLLTNGTVADMAGEIQRFLDNTGYDDPELTEVLTELRSLPLLAQRLTGSTEAMLMHDLVLQLPVSDPLGSPAQAWLTAEVATAVAKENSVAPLPEVSFNPLRTGALSIGRLRIADAFGRFKDYGEPSIVLSEALRPPATLNLPAGTAFLPPRITQPSRLLFHWLAASDDRVESNAAPAATPVFGWLVPNWLDRALVIYNEAGTALGELTLSAGDTAVLWTPAPGGQFPPTATIETVFAGQHPQLRDFAIAVYAGGDPTFLAPFFAAIRESLDFTLPAAFRESAETAVLAGQPLALARAALRLEVPGGTAASQSWPSFTARVVNNAPPDDAALHTVEFPVRLGGPERLDDSLVSFWLTKYDGTTDWRSCYVPGVSTSKGGVRPPGQDTITLCPTPGGRLQKAVPQAASQAVTLLLDPRGSVHATTGVLPVAEIAIPPGNYAGSLASLYLALATRPVLSGSSTPASDTSASDTSTSNTMGMSLALPKVSDGQWVWVTAGGLTPAGPAWQVEAAADAPPAATLDYTPQRISEGWLVMRPLPATPLTPVTTATSDTQERTEDGESQL